MNSKNGSSSLRSAHKTLVTRVLTALPLDQISQFKLRTSKLELLTEDSSVWRVSEVFRLFFASHYFRFSLRCSFETFPNLWKETFCSRLPFQSPREKGFFTEPSIQWTVWTKLALSRTHWNIRILQTGAKFHKQNDWHHLIDKKEEEHFSRNDISIEATCSATCIVAGMMKRRWKDDEKKCSRSLPDSRSEDSRFSRFGSTSKLHH